MKKPNHTERADTVVVLDVETTGLSPAHGDRVIEVGAVRLKEGEIVDRFHQLMNPGFEIEPAVEELTEITNDMLRDAPTCSEAISQFMEYLGEDNLVAHNASFDRQFLDAKTSLLNRAFSGEFTCSLAVARRLYRDAPNYQLGALVRFKDIPSDGVFHHTLADAEMTARLWRKMLDDVAAQYDIANVSFGLMQKFAQEPVGTAKHILKNCR